MTLQQDSKQQFVILAAINASLGFFLYFYVISIFNSVQETLEKHIFPESSLIERSLYVSTPIFGGVIGAITTEAFGKKFGRRSVMILINLIMILGVIFTLIPNSLIFIIGRVLTGFSSGVSVVIITIYITEISSEPLRGQLGMIPAIIGAIAVLVALLLGNLMIYFVEKGLFTTGYRILMGLPAVFSVIKILNLLLFFRFETPFYLVLQNEEHKAREALELLYEDKHSEILNQVIGEKEYLFETKEIEFRDLFDRKDWKALLVSFILSGSTTIMGGIVPLTFSNMIFSEGMETSYGGLPMLLTSLIGIVNPPTNIIGLLIMRYYGKRRVVGICGTGLIALINLIITLIIYFDSVQNMAVKILVVVWITVFCIFLGGLGFMYPAESLPEIGVGVITALSFLFGFLIAQMFLPAKEWIGYGGIYVFFTCAAILSFIIVWLFMVETKDRSKLEVFKLYGEYKEEEETGLLEKKIE